MYSGTLNNCTVTGNSARDSGGGAYNATLYNCIVYFNTAAQDPNFDYRNTLMNFCCTTPMPAYGFGNTTNEPAFVTPAVADIRLETNSTCINAGPPEAWWNDRDGTRNDMGIFGGSAYDPEGKTTDKPITFMVQALPHTVIKGSTRT